MKTTTYEWNTFEEAKPFDGDVILIKLIDSNSRPRIIQYHFGMPSIELLSLELIDNLENYYWTNLQNENNS
jgi:hypothetical protein